MHRAIRHGQPPPPVPRVDPPHCPSWCTGFCVGGANHRAAVRVAGATAHLSAPRHTPGVVTVTTDHTDPPLALLLAIACAVLP